MPTKIVRRDKKCTKGTVCLDGRIVKSKQFSSWSKRAWLEARDWEIAKKKEILKQREYSQNRGFTLADWHKEYLDHTIVEHSKKTYKEKFAVFDRFVDEFGDETKVEEIIPSLVREYMFDQELERSGNAVNKDRKNLSAGWNWAKKSLDLWPVDYAHQNPFLAIPRCKEQRHERYIPPANDFWKLVDYAMGQDKVILVAAYCLAARRGELWRLEWKKDLNFSEKLVRLGTIKTDDGSWKYKWLPMDDNLLYKALLWQWENVRTTGHDHIFWSQAKGSSHYGNPYVARQHWMKQLCVAAKVKPFGMHAIRHRRAIDLYKSGTELCEIQDVLRHDKPTTTEIYLRKLDLDLSDLRKVMQLPKTGKVVTFG